MFQKAYEDRHVELARRLRADGRRTLLDLCDNHLFAPEGEPGLADRAERVRQMLDAVDGVATSTPELADRVGRDAIVVDDALDPVPPHPWSHLRRYRKSLRLVWFGNAGSIVPAFGIVDLAGIVPDLVDARASGIDFHLLVVSNDRAAYERAVLDANFPHRFLQWRRGVAPLAVTTADVALLPIRANPFTICKTANRVVTALRSGLAVVADPIPSYLEFRPYVRFADWRTSLDAYADPTVRRGDVESGAAYAERRFGDGEIAAQWEAAITGVLSRQS